MRFQLRSVLAAMAVAMFCGSTAKAVDLMFTIQQIGPDVVFNGSGSVNTAAFGTPTLKTGQASVNPSLTEFVVGPSVSGSFLLRGPLTGSKPSIGTGTFTAATSGSGNYFGLNTSGSGGIYLPNPYVSGSPLSGSAVFANTTVAALGLTPGTYTWTWGSGATAGSAQMTISNVPEPSTYALGAIATGVMALIARRRQKARG